MLEILGVPFSAHTRKVLVALHEKPQDSECTGAVIEMAFPIEPRREDEPAAR